MNERSEQFRCRHIFTEGRRCGSASLRAEQFCYFHHTTRRPAPRPRNTAIALGDDFQIALPEDRHAIQHAIGEILRRVAANQLDSRRAALLLYGLQIASANLPRATKSGKETKPAAADLVDEVIADLELGSIAPLGEPLDPTTGLTYAQQRLFQRAEDGRELAEIKLAAVLKAFPEAASAIPAKIALPSAPYTYDEEGKLQWKPEVYNLPSAT